jgi:uncharacterized protein YdaU (DUF1376 family)
MSLPYYLRYPEAFADATFGWPLELKGAYSIILDMIYARDGKLMDDARGIAGALGCSVRKWNQIKSKLIELGKLQVVDGIIRNSRADDHLISRRTYQDKQAKNRAAPNKNKAKAKPAKTYARDLIPSEDISSEPKGSGADAPPEPVSVKAQIWAVGRPMFDAAGTSKAAAGAVIGKLIKTKGEIEALSIITAMRADPPMDPEAYLWAIIRGKAAPAVDHGAAPQLELVMIDGKPTMQPIGRRAA